MPSATYVIRGEHPATDRAPPWHPKHKPVEGVPMRSMSATRILDLAVLVSILQLLTVTAQTARTNTLETYRTAYDAATARITADIQKQKDDALAQYGKTLDGILKSLKQKGDIDGYTIVQQEAKRFGTDKTVPTNAPTALIVPAIASYQKQVQAADADSTVRQTALLKQYISALNGLIMDLMAKDKIEDAKTAGEVRKAAEATLAELNSKAALPAATVDPPPVPPVESPQPTTPAVSNPEPQGTSTTAGSDRPFVYGGHRYKYIERIHATYSQTLEACQALGGHPVTFNTTAEWAWVRKTFLAGDRIKEFRTVYFGIALADRQWWTDADVKWVDGDRFNMKTADWEAGHPWNHRDATGFRFRWIMNYKGQWAAVGPTNERVSGFLCEWDGMQGGGPVTVNADVTPQGTPDPQPVSFSSTEPAKTGSYLCDLTEVSQTGGTPYGLVKAAALVNWPINGETPRHALFAHAPSSITYDLSGLNWSRLEGGVGIGRVNVNSSVKFRIYGDNRLLWESDEIRQVEGSSRSMTAQYAVDISGVEDLKLETDSLGDNNSDHSIWIDPRLSRTPGSRTAPGTRPLREPLPAQASPASPVANSFVLSGPQEGDEVRLTKAREYTLRGNYSIPAGKILTIEAGVTVRAERDAFLQVFGSLNVEGTENSPVVLCGETSTPGYWKGICGEPQSTVVNFAVIRDATSAITLPKGTITNCLLTGNKWGLLSKNCSIANCIIEKNENGAIHCDFGTTTIEHCTVQRNGSNPKAGGDLARRGIVFGKPNGKFAMSNSLVADNADIGVADYRHASIVEGCIVENNKPADFCVTESNLQVNNCWMGEAVQRTVDQKGYGANLSNVIDIHDGRQGTVIFTAGPKTRPEDCGATLNLRLPR